MKIKQFTTKTKQVMFVISIGGLLINFSNFESVKGGTIALYENGRYVGIVSERRSLEFIQAMRDAKQGGVQ